MENGLLDQVFVEVYSLNLISEVGGGEAQYSTGSLPIEFLMQRWTLIQNPSFARPLNFPANFKCFGHLSNLIQSWSLFSLQKEMF